VISISDPAVDESAAEAVFVLNRRRTLAVSVDNVKEIES
jgi:hypothetical protein